MQHAHFCYLPFFLFLRRIIQILFRQIYLLIRLNDCLNHRAIGKYLTWLLGKFHWKHLEWSLLEQNSLLNISLIYSQIILSSDGILLPNKRLLKSLSLIISLYQMCSFNALFALKIWPSLWVSLQLFLSLEFFPGCHSWTRSSSYLRTLLITQFFTGCPIV